MKQLVPELLLKTEKREEGNRVRERERVDEREMKGRGWMLMILIINSDPSIHRPWRSGIPATDVDHILYFSRPSNISFEMRIQYEVIPQLKDPL